MPDTCPTVISMISMTYTQRSEISLEDVEPDSQVKEFEYVKCRDSNSVAQEISEYEVFMQTIRLRAGRLFTRSYVYRVKTRSKNNRAVITCTTYRFQRHNYTVLLGGCLLECLTDKSKLHVRIKATYSHCLPLLIKVTQIQGAKGIPR
jgi:hypothetical protein